MFFVLLLTFLLTMFQVSWFGIFGIRPYVNIQYLENYLQNCKLNSFTRSIIQNGDMYISKSAPFLLCRYYISDFGANYAVYRWSKQHKMIDARFKELNERTKN